MRKETKKAVRRQKTHTIHRWMRYLDNVWVDDKYGKTIAVIAPNLPKYVLDFAIQGGCKEMVWSDDHADYIIHPSKEVVDGKHVRFEIDITFYGETDKWKIAWYSYIGQHDVEYAGLEERYGITPEIIRQNMIHNYNIKS